MGENYRTFEDLISFNLCDKDATITGCKLFARDGLTSIIVTYAVSDEFARKENLRYRNRIMEIVLQRGETFEGLPIMSYANTQGVR